MARAGRELWWQDLAAGFWQLFQARGSVCPLCQEREEPEEGWPCPACRSRVRYFSPPVCPRCGWPPPGGGPCACPGPPAGLAGVAGAGAYAGALRECLHSFKYRGRTDLLPFLLQGLEGALARARLPQDPVVVPVPLHRNREWQRGFNQALLLSRGVARSRGLELGDALERGRDTPANSGLSAPARRQSLGGAFAWRGGALGGRAVLLVDDILTTGATAAACAEALERAGAGPVSLLAVGLVPLSAGGRPPAGT